MEEQKNFGLALSGGGIRSATFNLGLLQGLAKKGWLSKFDYLSTVSGGGYIGGWLSAWIQRTKGGVEEVEAELARSHELPAPAPIAFLRRFSNFMTPRRGVLSGDTQHAVAIYVRNLLLNQATLVAWLSALLLLPFLLATAARLFSQNLMELAPVAALACLLLAQFVMHFSLADASTRHAANPNSPRPFYSTRGGVIALVVLPLLLAAIAFVYWVSAATALPRREFLFDAAIACASLLALRVICGWLKPRQNPLGGRRRLAFFYLLSLFAAAAIVCACAWVLRQLLGSWSCWAVFVWAVPAGLTTYAFGLLVFTGVSGREAPEFAREWWGRLGASLLLAGFSWIVIVGSALYGPVLVVLLGKWISSALAAAWSGITAAGVWKAASESTGGKDSNPWAERFVAVVPYVFIVGLLLGLSFAVYWTLGTWLGVYTIGFDAEGPASEIWWRYGMSLNEFAASNRFWLVAQLAFTLCIGVGAFLSWRIDINLFSFHMFYRNRLVRCYLGASRPNRNAHPFTGFDPDDDLPLAGLAKQRPQHILGTALNLSRTNNLAWQERKAASFVFSGEQCGYFLADSGASYQNTPATPQLSLGMAMAISGAAASPNMGYHTSTAVAFLMTVFNVRLGWWIENPRGQKKWRAGSPSFGGRYLFEELLARASDDLPHVYVSDGGHFENLGIYELVRRGCRFIVASDAGQDGKFDFEDLGNAVRKCEIDLGVRIDIDTRAIRPQPLSRYHCAMGTIHYPSRNGKPGAVGFLLYLKPSLTGDETIDVKQYAQRHPDFPHQSTADLWFEESQFESYRNLGEQICDTVLRTAPQGAALASEAALEQAFEGLRHRWYAPSGARSFSEHSEQLSALQDLLREQINLGFLDPQVWPEWSRLMRGEPSKSALALPADAAQRRAGFYVCNRVLELMERVYYDLNLEEQSAHPDNRGWMNMFRHWSWSSMFRVTYAIAASTYGARFQDFCRRELDLDLGEIVVETRGGSAAELQTYLSIAEAKDELNFHEVNLARQAQQNDAQIDRLLLLRIAVADPANPAAAPIFISTFGFALAHGNSIVARRVQDHLRKMGLWRRAHQKIVATSFGVDKNELKRSDRGGDQT